MSQVPANPSPSPVDLSDVQGDVIITIPKRAEIFIFFTIRNDQVTSFRNVVGSEDFLEFITSTADVQEHRKKIAEQKERHGRNCPLIPFVGVNIAFTHQGLDLLGLTGPTNDLKDEPFTAGQLAHAKDLGDTGKIVNGKFDPDWLPEFKKEIHGLILIAGESERSILAREVEILALLDDTITQVLRVRGHVRPGDQKGHEHFGYRDGISSPAPRGIVDPFPGQQVVDPGVLLLGQPGDPNAAQRPAWAKNGSFLVYRHLNQLVPEFDKFKRDNALFPLDLGIDPGAELLGSRIFGRWKSGAPIDITPLKDDPVLADDPLRNNNFDFSNPTDQTHCPFAAHIRKTNPRSDLGAAGVAPHAILRSGIAFGPEVTESERRNNKTELVRGLSFVCYQSTLNKGFEFMQESWANNVGFIFGKIVDGKPFQPGFDPVIGQNGSDPKGRLMGGFNPKSQASDLTLPIEFVQSKGGAYFFSPSLSALQTKIGLK